jgi:DNA-binding transcriptional ArsR family regulator
MASELDTVKSQVSGGGDGTRRSVNPAEDLRLRFADAWGDMSASWGVAPAIGRVHAYLMVRAEPLTEREIREALGLSHRAASLALADAEEWGIVERVSEPRRVGRRGPAGTRMWRSATTGSGSPP